MKPILFNTEMLRAILEGRKTVTRRVVKPQTSMPYCHEVDGEWFWTSKDADDDMMDWWPSYETGLRPPYRTGDILYVRETWAPVDGGGYIYRAGFRSDKPLWRPSIHMPREAARIFLRVTDVRVERLQDITVEGVLREGVPDIEPPPICRKEPSYPESFPKGFDKWNTEKQDDWIQSEARARYIGWCEYADKLLGHFKTVWDSTIKPAYLSLYGWEANPWVWVIEFERISKPE